MSTNPQVNQVPASGDDVTPPTSFDALTSGARPSAGAFAANVARGVFIGLAETVPGVSGGTVALVTGIYARLISSARGLVDLPRAVLARRDWKAEARQIDWWLLGPVAIGMIAVVFSIAGAMESFVTDQPVYSRALFMGMIAMSVVVPFLEIRPGTLTGRPDKVRAVGVFAAAAAVVFAVTSLPRTELTDPPLVLVFAAAAVAVCALVLPGVSGSFFLLVIGIYAPTMAAIDSMNVGYLAVFALGAVVGLATFVRVLEWLLHTRHTMAMVAASGLLLGSLRALWPWQTDDGSALGIGSQWPGALGLFILGAAAVGIVVAMQLRFARAGIAPAAQHAAD